MSKLLEKIADVFSQKRESARDRYFAALRKRDAEAAVAAAGEAGILQEQISADVRVLERAEVLRPAAEKLPGIIANRASLVADYEKAQRELDDAVARLQPLALQAALNARAAEELERQTREQVNELRGLFADNPELLPPATAPKVVKELDAAASASEAASAAKIGKQRRLQAARERVESVQAVLSAAGRSHTYMGMRTALNGPAPEEHEKRITAAQAELAEAENEEALAAADLEAPGK